MSTPVVHDARVEPFWHEHLHIAHLLQAMVEIDASDLHIAANTPILVRVHGRLKPLLIPQYQGRVLVGNPEQIKALLDAILTEETKAEFERTHDLDFAYEPATMNVRFRCNYLYCQSADSPSSPSAVFRQIPTTIKTVEQLNLPSSVRDLVHFATGLVLVTGPTGSGKSTTLAALIDEINRIQPKNILTIEDPVEFTHHSKKAMVRQREIGVHGDSRSFSSALRASLRQDPDVILVGEMRDPETVALALTAAETGHLVFSTLHSQSSSETITRIIDQFEGDQQAQVKTQLSMTLKAVLSQRLVPTADGTGRRVAIEILLANNAVQSNIKSGEIKSIYSVIQNSVSQGMQTMEQSLARLQHSGEVSLDDARNLSQNREEFDRALMALQGVHRA